MFPRQIPKVNFLTMGVRRILVLEKESAYEDASRTERLVLKLYPKKNDTPECRNK